MSCDVAAGLWGDYQRSEFDPEHSPVIWSLVSEI